MTDEISNLRRDVFQSLGNLENSINAVVNNNQTFTTNIKVVVEQIAIKVEELKNKIRQMKQQIVNLTHDSSGNAENIRKLTTEVESLNQQLMGLEGERTNIQQKQVQLTTANQENVRNLEEQIRECNNKLPLLQSQITEREQEIESLKKQLNEPGQNYAQDLENMRKQNEADMNQMRENYESQMQQQREQMQQNLNNLTQERDNLQQQINELLQQKSQMEESIQKLSEENNNLQERLRQIEGEIESGKQELERNIQEKNARIEELTQMQNNLVALINEIKQKIVAINTQIQDLNLTSEQSYSLEELNKIFQTINELLNEEVSTVSEASLQSQVKTQVPGSGRINARGFEFPAVVVISGQTIPFEKFMEMLAEKVDQTRDNIGITKFRNLRSALNAVENNKDFKEILGKFSIKNGLLQGGRRTRKIKAKIGKGRSRHTKKGARKYGRVHQKGGFTYGKSSARKNKTHKIRTYRNLSKRSSSATTSTNSSTTSPMKNEKKMKRASAKIKI